VIEETTGAPPTVTDTPGQVAGQICEEAGADDSSLIVIGRRGLSGIKALGSVNGRVAHGAPCSVLVAPPSADRQQ